MCLTITSSCILNPYFLRGAWLPVELFRKMSGEASFYGEVIGELESIAMFIQRAGYLQLYLLIHLGLLGLGVLSFVVAWSRGRFDLFRLLVFGAFAWLSFKATRNSGQFALITGAVVAWNFCHWQVTAAANRAWSRVRASGGRAVVAGLLGLSLWGVGSGRFYSIAGEGRLVGLDEQPLWHAHRAAQFAAEPDMPQRMLAYHLGQAALFEFHKRDDQQVFCDPRLEVVSRETLQQYHRIQQAIIMDQGWNSLLHMQNVRIILTDHRNNFAIEATLLASAEWKCVRFDPVAAVYLDRAEADRLRLAGWDPAARHFELATRSHARPTPEINPTPAEPQAEMVEAKALLNIARQIQEHITGNEELVHGLLLLAGDKAQRSAQRYPNWFEPSRLLGMAAFHSAMLALGSEVDLERSGSRWDPVTMLDLARARYGLRLAVDLAPKDFISLSYLYFTAQFQRDRQTQRDAAEQLFQQRRTPRRHKLLENIDTAVQELTQEIGDLDSTAPVLAVANLEQLRVLTDDYLERGFLKRAADQFAGAVRGEGKLPWALADRYGCLLMRIGRPARARRLWQEQLAGNWDESRRLERIASTYLVERDYEQAIASYRTALRHSPGQIESLWGLAKSLLESGDAQATLRECQRGLRQDNVPAAAREAFERMLLLAHEPGSRQAQS